MKKKGEKTKQPEVATSEAMPKAVAGEWEFDKLLAAPYNPRDANDQQIRSIAISILEFGIVDPLIVREDGLLIGGHQRQKAIAMLLSGPFKYKGADGKPKTVEYKLPGGLVPVMVVTGLSEDRTKLLNLALNKTGGDWNSDMLAHLLKDLSNSMTMEELAFSGFPPAELTDYLDLSEELVRATEGEGPSLGEFGDGHYPQPTTKAPSLAIDFSSKELRDAVKAKIAATTSGDQPSGDALAKLLGVSAKVKRR